MPRELLVAGATLCIRSGSCRFCAESEVINRLRRPYRTLVRIAGKPWRTSDSARPRAFHIRPRKIRRCSRRACRARRRMRCRWPWIAKPDGKWTRNLDRAECIPSSCRLLPHRGKPTRSDRTRPRRHRKPRCSPRIVHDSWLTLFVRWQPGRLHARAIPLARGVNRYSGGKRRALTSLRPATPRSSALSFTTTRTCASWSPEPALASLGWDLPCRAAANR